MEKQQVDRLRNKGVNEESIIFLRLIKPHFVHVVPAAKPFLLRPVRKLFETPSGVLIQPDHSVEKALKGDGRKDRLIELIVHKALVVEAHELLRERRSAPRRRHDENRFANRLPLEAREE